jgi:hypothetical protein
MTTFFDEIAALASGTTPPTTIIEAAAAYEKEGVKRMVKLWKR